MAKFSLKSDDFQQHNPIISIRDNPDVMVGSAVERSDEFYTIFDLETKLVTQSRVSTCPASIKLFKEIFSNATDNIATTIMHSNWDSSGKLKSGKLIPPKIEPIDIEVTSTTVEITSRGDPIPISPCKESSEKELILPPKRVFGVIYSGTNNNKEKLNLGAGKNGIGAKATNILSTEFIVSVGNNIDGQEFQCVWKDNMLKIDSETCKPGFEWNGTQWVSLVNNKNRYTGENYVKVKYSPDFKRYNWTPYDFKMACLFAKIAASGAFASKIKVIFKYKLGKETSSPVRSESFKKIEFDYSKPNATLSYLKLFQTSKGDVIAKHSYEKMIWDKSSVNGQFRQYSKNYKSVDKLHIDEQRAIASNPACIEDFPFGEIYIYDTPNKGKGVFSFVNGNETSTGIHVCAVIKPLIELIKSKIPKDKVKNVTESLLFQHITAFCLFRLHQPTYDEQAKNKLCSYKEPKITNKKTGESVISMVVHNKITIPDYDTKVFLGWESFQMIIASLNEAPVEAKKLTANSKNLGIAKLDDANLAGGERGFLCTLFVPEGDAAKDYPTELINLLPGKRDRFGVFPLRGKIPNVLSMSHERFQNSAILGDLIKAIGLQANVDYRIEDNAKTLRYGRLCCVKDADVDGSHINCLLINFLYDKYPSFLLSGRYSYFETPIVRVEKILSSRVSGLPKVEIINRFYAESDFEEWRKKTSGESKNNVKIKYLKGLATSNENDRKDDAIHGRFVVIMPDTNIENVLYTAFSKKMSITGLRMTDLRKQWIYTYSVVKKCVPTVHKFGTLIEMDYIDEDDIRQTTHLQYQPAPNPTLSNKRSRSKISDSGIPTPEIETEKHFRLVDNLINTDLIDYSLASLERAIPSIRDGLKRSQRQAMWVILDKWNYGNTSNSLKISRLASDITSKVHYKHGETSMQMVIIKHCQEFTGGNNMALYLPDGSFGTRRSGGHDVGPSKARYASTACQGWHQYMMDKKMTANVERRIEEDEKVEPIMIPMLVLECLINGRKGLATGYCSSIPPHNIFDLIEWYLAKCDNRVETIPLPWYKGYTGDIYIYNGCFTIRDNCYSVSASNSEIEDDELERSSEDEALQTDGLNDMIEETETGRKILENFLSKTNGQHLISYGKYCVLYDQKDLNDSPQVTKCDVWITELPIGLCHDEYKKKYVEGWIKAKIISGVIDGGDSFNDLKLSSKSKAKANKSVENSEVNIRLKDLDMTKFPTIDYDTLHLKTAINLSNMNLLNDRGYPVHYNNIGEIMTEHFKIMIEQFRILRESLINEKTDDVNMLRYKIILIRLINEGRIGTKQDETEWRLVMKQNGIPESHHNSLLKVPIRILTKGDNTKLNLEIDKLNDEIKILKSKTPNDLYREKLLALKNALDGNYPKNTNKVMIGSIAMENGVPMK